MAESGVDGAIIDIQDNVLIGSGVHIYVANHAFSDTTRPIIEQGHEKGSSVTLKNGCWIGGASVILPGVTIGNNAIVGAGSVVTRSVPSFTIVGGAPARIIRKLKESNE
jgi:acetyltransferase-like isoleucine patch superfamily enzyme